MSLPLSPPPSRSSSQRSSAPPFCKSTANSAVRASSISPPRHTAPPKRPILSIRSSTVVPTTFLHEPSADSGISDPRSFFSPCSSDEEDEPSPKEPGFGDARDSRRQSRRGHFQRWWANHESPVQTKPTAPAASRMDPQDTIRQRSQRRNSLCSPTFGKQEAANLVSSIPQLQPVVATQPACNKSLEMEVTALLAHDSETLAAQSRLFQLRQGFPTVQGADGLASLQHNLARNERQYLEDLNGLYHLTMQMLSLPDDSGMNPVVTAAKIEREHLVVQTQKAHLRRSSVQSIAAMHQKLAKAEEEVERLEEEAKKESLQAALKQRLAVELTAIERRARGELEIIEKLKQSFQPQADVSSQHCLQPSRYTTESPAPSESESVRSYFSDDDEEAEVDHEETEDEADEHSPELVALAQPLFPLESPRQILLGPPMGNSRRLSVFALDVNADEALTVPLPPLTPDEEIFLAAPASLSTLNVRSDVTPKSTIRRRPALSALSLRRVGTFGPAEALHQQAGSCSASNAVVPHIFPTRVSGVSLQVEEIETPQAKGENSHGITMDMI